MLDPFHRVRLPAPVGLLASTPLVIPAVQFKLSVPPLTVVPPV